MFGRFVRFNVVSALGIGVQLAVLWLLVHAAGVHYLVATVAAVGAAVAHNFLWHRAWTWADRPLTRAAEAGRAFARFAAANGVVSLGGNLACMAVLVDGFGITPVAANVAAIAACGVLNFWLGDRVVFRLEPYSARSAVSGSTRDARHAGMAPATVPTSRMPESAAVSVPGSRGERP